MIILWRLFKRWRAQRAAGKPAPTTDSGSQRGSSEAQARATTPLGGGPLALVLHQTRYDLLGFMRNRQARFSTLLLPLLFLVIFVTVFGNDTVGPQQLKSSTYFVPGIAAMGVIAASFVNLVISIVTQRESGGLKRRRATPVPAWVLIAGRTMTAMSVSLAVMAALLGVGALAYGVDVPASSIPAVLLTGLVGSAAFAILGYAVASVISSADAAQPMVQAITLPLYFISGVFIPNLSLPSWLANVGSFFPIEHLADGLHTALQPGANGIAWTDLGVLALWAVVGLAVALRRFSWVPLANA